MPEPAECVDAVDYIAQTRAAYDALGYTPYQWANNPEPPPFVAPAKPLSESTIALVASGGIYRVGQVAFTHKDDVSHREIPSSVPLEELRVTHFAYDQTDARHDVGVVFPLAALRALEAEGVIGRIADVAITFMGGIYSQRRLRDELIPAIIERLDELEVDLVLLVPV
jgi:hypothetical protein